MLKFSLHVSVPVSKWAGKMEKPKTVSHKYRNIAFKKNVMQVRLFSFIIYVINTLCLVIISYKTSVKSFFFLNRCKQSPDGRIEVKGQHGSSSLRIKDVKLSDSGRYDCEAASRIGGHQKSMYLDIECKLFSFCMFIKTTFFCFEKYEFW